MFGKMECNRDIDIGLDLTFCYITGENDCNKQVEQINDLLDRSDCASYWGSTTKTPLKCQVVDADSYPDKFTWGTAVNSHCARLLGVMQLITEEITEDPTFPGDKFELGCIFGKLYIKSADETEYTAYADALNELITKQTNGKFHGSTSTVASSQSTTASTSQSSTDTSTQTSSETTTVTTVFTARVRCQGNFLKADNPADCTLQTIKVSAAMESCAAFDNDKYGGTESLQCITDGNEKTFYGNSDPKKCETFGANLAKLVAEYTEFPGTTFTTGCIFNAIHINAGNGNSAEDECAAFAEGLNDAMDEITAGTFFKCEIQCDNSQGASSLCYVHGELQDCEDQITYLNFLTERSDCAKYGGNPLTCKKLADKTYGLASAVTTSSANAQADCIKTAQAIGRMVKELTLESVGFPGVDYPVTCHLSTLYVDEKDQGVASEFAGLFSALIDHQRDGTFHGCEAGTDVDVSADFYCSSSDGCTQEECCSPLPECTCLPEWTTPDGVVYNGCPVLPGADPLDTSFCYVDG
eukprot:gene21074-19778_t